MKKVQTKTLKFNAFRRAGIKDVLVVKTMIFLNTTASQIVAATLNEE